LNGLKGK